MNKPVFSFSTAKDFITEAEIKEFSAKALEAKKVLEAGSGKGNDFLGWVKLPVSYDKDEFARVKKASEKIRSNSEALLVIGIGGSYLGARAAIEFCKGNFHNMKKGNPQIFFAGNSISSTYHKELYEILKDKDFSINVISKSGTTTEPAIAFRVFKKLLEEKYGKEEAKERIFVTTDKNRGALLNLAKQEGYERF